MAGIAVYPPDNARAKKYYLAKTESESHSFYSPFVWVSNERVVFVDKWHDAISVVLIDVRDGIDATRTYIAPIPMDPRRPADWHSFVRSMVPINGRADAVTVRLSFDGLNPPVEVTIPVR